MAIHNPVTTCGVDSSGDSEAIRITDGAANALYSPTGAFISQATLTLSATSQALSDIPGGIPSTANTVMIQMHGGTADGYVSFDGTAATATDMLVSNASDKGPGTEIILSGNLNNINILGTAAAESLVCWFFT